MQRKPLGPGHRRGGETVRCRQALPRHGIEIEAQHQHTWLSFFKFFLWWVHSSEMCGTRALENGSLPTHDGEFDELCVEAFVEANRRPNRQPTEPRVPTAQD